MTRMPLSAALLLVASACGDDGNHFPIRPGGGGSGSSSEPDAGVGDGDASTTILGRVCLVGDPRALTTCASAGADGLTVMLGTTSATTTSTGAFVIDRPAGTGLIWRVSGPGVEPSALPLTTSTTIPVIPSNLYGDMLAATNAVLAAGDGAIIMRVANGSTAAAGVSAIPNPQPDSQVYYDGVSATDWGVVQTGTAGIVWIPSIATGTASVALDGGAAQSTITNIRVFAGTISFAFAPAP